MKDNAENKILSLLELEHKIDEILKDLGMDEGSLADIIIELEDKELIILKDKNWTLSQKGKDKLKYAKEELLKKLKIDYIRGNISKEEFQLKKRELESIATIETHHIEDKTENKKLEDEKKINCSKCGKDNKAGSKYCYKCGEPFKSI